MMKKYLIGLLIFAAYCPAKLGANKGKPTEQVIMKLKVLYSPDNVKLMPDTIAAHLPGGKLIGTFPQGETRIRGLEPKGKYYVLISPAGDITKTQRVAILQLKDAHLIDEPGNVLKDIFD